MVTELTRDLPDLPFIGRSVFSLLFLILMQLADLWLTLVHSRQEREGRLWKYFGDIAGIQISDSFGLIVFFYLLTGSLWVVGIPAIIGAGLWPQGLTFGSLGLLIGCRVSDSIFSHILPWVLGRRPNPGLPSVPFYVVEAVLLILVFSGGLSKHSVWAIRGFAAGVVFFASIIPALWLSGLLFSGLRIRRP